MTNAAKSGPGVQDAADARVPQKVVAILSYHKIGAPPPGGWETWFYIPEERFARQLEFLRAEGWVAIDHAALLRGLSEPDTLPDRASLITFDDGYSSTMKVALPWLEQFGCPAVLFMPTDFVGGQNTFDGGSEPEERMCDWDELKYLQRTGVSIQSHGASHRRFSELALAEQQEEVTRSKAMLENKLGRRVEIIAYPYGDPGGVLRESARSLRDAGYRAACTYGGGPVSLPTAKSYQLPRLAMGPDTDLEAELRTKANAVPLSPVQLER